MVCAEECSDGAQRLVSALGLSFLENDEMMNDERQENSQKQ